MPGLFVKSDVYKRQGEYHGRRALMSFEVGKKALDFLIANSGKRRNLEVDFVGGEPLMNWEVVKQLVEYGRSKEEEYNKKFRFTSVSYTHLLRRRFPGFRVDYQGTLDEEVLHGL